MEAAAPLATRSGRGKLAPTHDFLRQDERRARRTASAPTRHDEGDAINLVNKEAGKLSVTHDTDYFRRRAAEARAAACSKDEPERVEIAGELALAYAALARRRAAAVAAAEERAAIPLAEPA
jgi:hypothetical protein